MLILGLIFLLSLSILQSACVSDTRLGNHSLNILRDHKRTETVYGRTILLEDNVVAFGKVSLGHQQTDLQNIVIAGQKQSYVLSQGGDDLVQLLSELDPEYFDLGLDLAGKIYPAAENLADLKALTQPYPIVIYSSIREEKSKPLMSTTEKIVTLPITLLLDALELPFDLLDIKYQP